MSTWLMGDDRVLPRPLRWVFFTVSLLVLGGIYAATGSEAVQILALFVLTYVVLTVATRRFGQHSDFLEAARHLKPPLGVVAMSFVFLVLWGALIFVAAPDLGLGPWFWPWVVLWPWLEVYIYLAERRLHKDGGAEGWKPMRPLRDSVPAGLATVLLTAAITILQGFAVGEALLTGLLCGFFIFGLSATLIWLWRRANDAQEPA